MKDYTIQNITAAFGALFGFLFGKIDVIFYVLLSLVCIDFVSGMFNGAISENLNSKVCYKGIIKKVFIFVMVAMSHLVDMAINQNIVMNICMFFYIANESLSIIENAALAGLPIPNKIIKLLEQLKKENDQEVENDS